MWLYQCENYPVLHSYYARRVIRYEMAAETGIRITKGRGSLQNDQGMLPMRVFAKVVMSECCVYNPYPWNMLDEKSQNAGLACLSSR
jgi:hypothetical protein